MNEILQILGYLAEHWWQFLLGSLVLGLMISTSGASR